jgi:hypothetical protein
MTQETFPKFDSYVCPNDSIAWSAEGFDFVAIVEHDSDTDCDMCDCYTPEDVERWKNDEWWFGGVVVSVWRNGHLIEDHAASLWGIECNFGEDNDYLSEVAQQLQAEALQVAKTRALEIVKALTE